MIQKKKSYAFKISDDLSAKSLFEFFKKNDISTDFVYPYGKKGEIYTLDAEGVVCFHENGFENCGVWTLISKIENCNLNKIEFGDVVCGNDTSNSVTYWSQRGWYLGEIEKYHMIATTEADIVNFEEGETIEQETVLYKYVKHFEE